MRTTRAIVPGALALAALLASTPRSAVAQSFVGPTTVRTFAGCAEGSATCLFMQVTMGAVRDRYQPPGQPRVGDDWLGVAFRWTLALDRGYGLASETRFGNVTAVGTLSIDLDERQPPPSCTPLYNGFHLSVYSTCTGGPVDQAQAFASPDWVPEAITLRVFEGVPGTFVSPGAPGGPSRLVTIRSTVTPEPSTTLLLATGLVSALSLGWWRRRA